MSHSAALEVVADYDDAPDAPDVLDAPETSLPTVAVPERGPSVPRPVAERLKASRQRHGLSVRGLARQVGVSASLVSQIENGKANPSVATLYAIVLALGLSLDELFDLGGEQATKSAAPPPPELGSSSAVLRVGDRHSLTLDSGVRWDRLTPEHEDSVDFLDLTFAVGAASCQPDALLRHNGREHGVVISGRLGATVGFDSYELGPGDSISLDASAPHRFWAIGDEPARVIWTVIGRDGRGAPAAD